MCGSADFSAIPEDEKAFVLSLDQFLRIPKSCGYRQEFKDSRSGTPNQYVQTFTPFFRGKDFKPSGCSFNNFQIVGEASFPHPDGLYKEYKSVKKDDHRHEALLRRWNFSALTGVTDTVDERARIALREHKVLGFIHEQNEQLDGVVLQPLSHPTRDDIDTDFCELYRLPLRQLRLNEFVFLGTAIPLTTSRILGSLSAETISAQRPKISERQYQAIQPGMTYDEVLGMLRSTCRMPAASRNFPEAPRYLLKSEQCIGY